MRESRSCRLLFPADLRKRTGEVLSPPATWYPDETISPSHEIGLKRIPATKHNYQTTGAVMLSLLPVRHAEAPFGPLMKVQTRVVGRGVTSMSRNFGLRRQTYSGYRGSSWGPLVALTLIMVHQR
jgi:hypothetical protein